MFYKICISFVTSPKSCEKEPHVLTIPDSSSLLVSLDGRLRAVDAKIFRIRSTNILLGVLVERSNFKNDCKTGTTARLRNRPSL